MLNTPGLAVLLHYANLASTAVTPDALRGGNWPVEKLRVDGAQLMAFRRFSFRDGEKSLRDHKRGKEAQ